MSEPNIHYYLYRFDKTTQEEGLLNYFVNYLCSRFDNYFSYNKEKDLEILVRNS